MTINTSSKEQAIARILEMILARERFNQELIRYLNNASLAEAKKYLIRNSSEFRDIDKHGTAVDELAKSATLLFISAIQSDLKYLATQKQSIELLLKNDDRIHVLHIVIDLFLKIEQEKYNIAQLKSQQSERNLLIARQARNDAKKNSSGQFNHKTLLNSASTAAKLAVAQEEKYASIEQSSELALCQEILSLLFASNIAGQMEKDLVEKYLEIEFVPGSYILRNKKSLLKMMNSIGGRILVLAQEFINCKNINLEMHETFILEINAISATYQQIKNECLNGVQNIAAIYKGIYEMPPIIADLERRIQDEVAAERNWQKEQDEIMQVEQQRLQGLCAIEAAKEQQRILALSLEKREQDALFAAQVEKQKQQEILNKQYQEQQLVAATEIRTEQLKKRKADLQANRVINEVARRKDRLKAIKDAQKITIADDSVMSSTFKLSQETIEKKSLELIELFDRSITTIPYRKAVKLISDLGGEVDDSSGSSHQRIIFTGCIYSEIQTEETEGIDDNQATICTVSCVKKGFARKSEISGFNLTLLRQAIACVLPEGWEEKLKYKPKDCIVQKA